MPVRARLALILAASFVLAGALGVVLFASSGSRDDGGAGFQGSLQPEGIRPADFHLRDQDGKAVRLADFRGKPLMLTFLYSRCRDTCPLTADQIRGAMDEVGHDVPALAVSVDPAGDTPLNARRFLSRRGLTGRMQFLLGDRAQLAPVWKAYGIQPQGKAFDHSAHVLLIDAQGRQRVGWPVSQLTPEGLAHDLRVLERQAS